MPRPGVLLLLAAVAAAPLHGTARAQAPAAHPRIAITPRTVLYGGTATLTGALARDATDAGASVALLERGLPGNGLYREIARTTAGPAGDFRFALRPTVNAYFAVRTRTDPVETSSGLLVRVLPRIDVKVSDASPRPAALVRFSGTVRPDLTGTLARVQRRGPRGGYFTVARTRLFHAPDGASAFTARVRVRRSGTFRVRIARSASLMEGSSRPHALRVQPRPIGYRPLRP